MIASACGGTTQIRDGSSPRPSATVGLIGAPGAFVAVRAVAPPGDSREVTISDAHTGRMLRVVLPDPWHGMQVQATAVASGKVWVTLSSGPRCSSGVEGCGPVPGSCAGQVITIAPTDGTPSVALTAPADELIADAKPSPDGSLLAYLDGSCDSSYFNQHLQVRDLRTGRSWSIGAALAMCHSLGSISWTPNGQNLVVAYGPSTLPPGAAGDYGHGTCQSPGPAQLAVVPALQGAPDLPGVHTAMDADCQAAAVTATKDGYAAIEACGSPDYLSGPALLLALDPTLHITKRTSIGACVDGAELTAGSDFTDLLGSSYQFCNPPGTTPPRTRTFTDTGIGPHTVIDTANSGTDAVTAISW
ncbi:MAG: hypothetical protein BGO26_19205 [Actinobacteria bacterium 69-20]|jgi:hypothetical protein|nr:MAG: hypothetical protein BGO26_19205 [Actinobacteria bacterium 69-20]